MTGFYPPKPDPTPKKLSPIKRFLRGRHNALSIMYNNSYEMKLGEVRSPHRRFYFPNDYNLVENILKFPARFPKSDLMGSLLGQLLGQSIFVTNGDLWEAQRRMMAPAFEQARITTTFQKMVDASLAMVDRMKESSDGEPYIIDSEMAFVTADIIFRTIYSREMTKEDSNIIFTAFTTYQELAYAHGMWTMAGIPQLLSIPRIRAKPHARTVRKLLAKHVAARLQAVNEGQEFDDILSSLLDAKDAETGRKFSEEELVDQVGIMFLAGHETTASALSWSLYLMSHTPQVVEKMTQEADNFWENGAKFSNLKLLKYTRDVFREAMRLYPPVPILPRDSVQKEFVLDRDVEEGSVLFVCPWLIHRQRGIWKDPDMFRPERFSDPEEARNVKQEYLPFSRGPRVCLGASFALQEGVIILSSILRHYNISVVEEHVPEPVARLTLRPLNGIAIRLTPRSV